MKLVLLLAVATSVCGALDAQTDSLAFDSYREMRVRVGTLYSEQKFAEAIEILSSNLDKYPDHVSANLHNLIYCYMPLEQYDRCIETLDYALTRGVWFNPWMLESEPWAPVRESDGYASIGERNDSLKQLAQAGSAPDLIVVTPEGYSSASKYPLFVALHGGDGNAKAFSKLWHSEVLSEQFIVAYVQSSQVISMTGFTWEDRELAVDEVTDACRTALGEYSVDTGLVVIGGFSSGGGLSLDIALGNSFPVSGFVALCPDPSGSTVTNENVAAAKQRGLRGTVITTGLDPRVDEHRKMTELFSLEGLQYQYMVSPGEGHWIPDDLAARIDQAVGHIRNR